MAREFDPTVKALADLSPADWLVLAGRARRRVLKVEDAELATILSGAADRVYRVQADPDYMLHLDFQAGHDSAQLPRRLSLYNGVFAYRHNLPVLTVAVLLHPGADSPQVTGLIQRTLPEEDEPYTFLRYRVIRVWLLSAEQLLKGGLGTLPLAPISNVTAAQVPEVVRRMKERLAGERNRRRVADMWAATYVLLGLRYSEAFADALLQGIVEMEESATYRALVAKGLAKGLAEGQAKGRAEEARRVLLMLGEEQLGPPSAKVRATIAGLEDVNRLERLLKKLRTATSWQDLLGSPAPRRNNDRRSKP